MEEQEQREKKPRGWFGTEVTRVRDRMDEIEVAFAEMKELIQAHEQLKVVSGSELVTNFANWERRVRNLERRVAEAETLERQLRALLSRAESMMKVLETRRGA